MPDTNIIALGITLVIIALATLAMRQGVAWLERKLPTPLPAAPGPTKAAAGSAYSIPADGVVTGIEVTYPSRAVAGEHAVAAWEQAKAEANGIPVIITHWPEDGRWTIYQRPEEILRAAATIAEPLPLLETDREPKPWPDDVVANTGSEVVRTYENGTRLFLPRVHVVSVPARDASEIPAYLGYGGWNGCPAPEVMVAALRQWQREYGAELVAISRDTMDIRVKRRPVTREEALKLARQQAVFCSDVVENPDDMLEELAATLMVSDWWFFWWD